MRAAVTALKEMDVALCTKLKKSKKSESHRTVPHPLLRFSEANLGPESAARLIPLLFFLHNSSEEKHSIVGIFVFKC